MVEITGTTRLFYMMAHPIAHVRTPEIMNPMFEARSIDAVMVPLHVHPDDFTQAWETARLSRNLAGIVVSVPLKAQALALSDTAHARARELGAANCVRRERDGSMVCDNYDGAGFMAGLAKQGHGVAGKRILLAGAGGAGSAIAFSLAKAGAAGVDISDTEGNRSRDLAGRVSDAYPSCVLSAVDSFSDPSGYDVVINATPCGLHEGDALPIRVDKLSPDCLVCDIIMKPADTTLLRLAAERGCAVHYGRHMLDEQMELFWDFFSLARA